MRQIIIYLFILVNSYANSASYNRGEMLFFTKACNGCHGASAEGGGINPRLAGKEKKYLIDKLYYFRKGVVGSQKQEMMVQFILHMSDKEIEDLATFLSQHKGNTTEDVADELLGGVGS